MPYDPKAALLASIEKAQAQAKAGVPFVADPSTYQSAQKDFVRTPVQQAPLQAMPQAYHPQATQAPQAPQNTGLLSKASSTVGSIGRGLLDQVLQPARFVEQAGKGLGISLSEMVSGRKYTPEEVEKINRYGGPGVQESIAKVITPKHASDYNTDSYKTTGEAVGGALQAAANLATPFTGGVPKQALQGGLLSAGGALERGESLGEATKQGFIGAGTSAVFAKGSDMVGNKFNKTAGIVDDLAPKGVSKGVSNGAPKGNAVIKPNVKNNLAREKAITGYENIIGIPKAAAKNEAKKAAGRFTGKDHRAALGTLIDENITLKAKSENGRQVFDTIGDIEHFNLKRKSVGSEMQAALESRPAKDIDLNILANRAKIKIRNLPNKTALAKNKMIKDIDELVQAQKVANGWKEGNKVAMSKSAKVTGGDANQFKSGLHDMSYKNGVLKQEADHLNILADEMNFAIDQRYGDFADVKALRKQYGDIKQAQDFLIGLNGTVVAGGRIPKLASRALGAGVGMALPIPLPGLKEYAGSEIAGRFHDVLTNPERLSAKVLGKLNKVDKTAFATNLVDKLKAAGVPMDKIGQILESMPELSGISAGIIMNKTGQGQEQPQSTSQGAEQQITDQSPQSGKYTPAQIGQRLKARHPELAEFSDEEIGQKMIAKHPELAEIAQ